MLALKLDASCKFCLAKHELSDCIAWQVCHHLNMSVERRVQVLSGMSSACGVVARADISEKRYLILSCGATKVPGAL